MNWLTARKDATGKKRLDRALEGLIDILGPVGAREVAGKVCIDFGAGYVPTDGVGLWLLGATEVYGVDYNDIAKPREIARAVRAADASCVASQLKALRLETGWADRLETLRLWARESAGEMPPGYRYIAPADVIESPQLIPRFDVLVSTSVLEHIPPSLVVALLDSLKLRENEDARQYHRVDLRDHRDFDNDPYGFLDPSRHFDAETESDYRGNGMALEDWGALLDAHSEWCLGVSTYDAGRPQLMPEMPIGNTHVVADSMVLRTVAVESARGTVDV